MFGKKVGSDACLVLDATYDNGTLTITQSFTLDDLVEATKTRMVVVRCDILGNILNGVCGAISTSLGGFECFATTTGSLICIAFSESDGVWTGTIYD